MDIHIPPRDGTEIFNDLKHGTELRTSSGLRWEPALIDATDQVLTIEFAPVNPLWQRIFLRAPRHSLSPRIRVSNIKLDKENTEICVVFAEDQELCAKKPANIVQVSDPRNLKSLNPALVYELLIWIEKLFSSRRPLLRTMIR